MQARGVLLFAAGCALGFTAGLALRTAPPDVQQRGLENAPRGTEAASPFPADPRGPARGRARSAPPASVDSAPGVGGGAATRPAPESPEPPPDPRAERLLALLHGREPFSALSPEARFAEIEPMLGEMGDELLYALRPVILASWSQEDASDVAARLLAVRIAARRIATDDRNRSSWSGFLRSVAVHDPDPTVWRPALAAVLGVADDDGDGLERALLAAAESGDADARRTTLGLLHRAGTPGEETALRLLANDGLSRGEEASLVESLVLAGRGSVLLQPGMSDSRALALVEAMWTALPQRERIADLVRRIDEIPCPGLQDDGSASWANLLCNELGRPDVALAAVRDASRPPEVRTSVLVVVLTSEDGAAAAVTCAGEVLSDPRSPAAFRREIVDLVANLGSNAFEHAVEVLRRAEAGDPNERVRAAAAAGLRDLTEE